MAKRDSHKQNGVEVQRGPISMKDQYSLNFYREPENTMRDMENLRMRQEKSTLTLHTPKK
jgi:hypothetical protein